MLTLPSCPYIIRSGESDVPSNYLDLFYDPEYTLFYGCQCDQVRSILYRLVLPLALTLRIILLLIRELSQFLHKSSSDTVYTVTES